MTPKTYKANGLDEESLKKYWTATDGNDKRKELKQLLCDRVKEGVEAGLKDYRIWHAVDLAYDAPFNQLAPTIVRDIISKHTETKDILDALKRWNVGVDDIICETVDSAGCKKTVVNIPAFFQVIVPLVKAYVTIRRAKLFNDRNVYPLLKYEPSKNTTVNRIIAEILTDIIATITGNYGYAAVLKQILLQTLQYGTCLQFPMEEWHHEKQLGEGGKETIVKEGLRYWLPHPTRFFYDLNHRPSSFNTDTGCEWAGYWRVDRFSNIADNEKYWNKKDIPYGLYGSAGWYTNYKQYFSEVSPCSLAWPSIERAASQGSKDDREAAVARYSTNDRDKAIMRVESFHKLIPANWGMGTYKYPTWMRFVTAADDTVLWCSPVPYKPVIYWGYDPDESRKRNSSMALEVIPFQDHFGNFLSQYIYSVKQNLTKFVWYDTAQVDAAMVESVQNLGKSRFQNVPFVPFNSRQARMAQTDPKSAFVPVTFPLHRTEEILQAMNTLLSVLERVLVLSSQEIGQAASHEQTAEETRNISANTLTRVMFTGSGIDDGMDAWKRQLATAARCYLDEEQSAQASMNVPGAEEALKHLGFKVKDDGLKTSKEVLQKVEVIAKMSKLSLDTFISTREGQDRTTTLQMANAMAQVLQPVLANERLFMAIGEQQIVDLINQFAILIGLPKDFKLSVQESAEPRARMEALAQEVDKMAKQIQQGAVTEAVSQAGKEIAQPLVDQIVETDKKVEATQAAVSKVISETGEVIKALNQRLMAVEQATTQVVQALAPPPPPGPMQGAGGMMGGPPPNAPMPA